MDTIDRVQLHDKKNLVMNNFFEFILKILNINIFLHLQMSGLGMHEFEFNISCIKILMYKTRFCFYNKKLIKMLHKIDKIYKIFF